MNDPTCGLKDHVTPVLLVPVTVGVNVAVWEFLRVAVVGFKEMETGGATRLTTALPLAVVSCTLVAVTTTACDTLMVAGAVYAPLLMDPNGGLMVQVTDGSVAFVTVAVNVAPCEGPTDTLAGLTLTETAAGAINRARLLADLVGSAELVAVTVTL